MPNPPPSSGGGWRLVPYIKSSGHSPVLDFLEQLRLGDMKRYAPFQMLRKEFESRGPFAVGGPYWEGLGGGLFDISWGRCRIYCSLTDPRQIMMLLGLIKRWRTFTNSDRRLCEQYKSDIESGAYDQEQREYRYQAYCERRGQGGPA